MKFEHQKLIEDNEIELENLPEELKTSIQLFNEKLEEYETAEEETDEAEVKELKAELKKLSSEISSEIREYLEEEELSEDEEDEEVKSNKEEKSLPKDKEGILKYLFTNNIRKVTKEDLKKYGYPVGFWDSFPMKGETIGNFKLSRNTTDEPFEILKIT